MGSCEIVQWIGPLGGLAPFRCSASVERALPPKYVTATTLEGVVKARLLPIGRRSWDIKGVAARGNELAILDAFYHGAVGPGPWVFVSEAAQTENLLTPGEALGTSPSILSQPGFGRGPGLQTGSGSMSVSSVIIAQDQVVGQALIADMVPVVGGKPITAAVWAVGVGARLTIHFYDTANKLIGGQSVIGGAASLSSSRISVTASAAPMNAASARIDISGASRYTHASAAWSTKAPAWGMGHGCRAAILDGIKMSIQRVNSWDNHKTLSAYDFTVQEVG